MIDVIMCTKGTRRTLPVALRCLENQKIVGKILIICPQELDFVHSYRDTELLKEEKNSCLAWARFKGISHCDNQYVAFVDDDVLLHKKHLVKLYEKFVELKKRHQCPVVVEGVLINQSRSRMDYPRTPYESRMLQLGERGFTHNTLFLRENVSDWNPPFIHAYEDLDLTRFIHNKGGLWFRFQQGVPSLHFSDHLDYSRKRWAFANARMRRFVNVKKLFNDSFRSLIYGMRLTLAKSDIRFLLQKTLGVGGAIYGFYSWDRFVKL